MRISIVLLVIISCTISFVFTTTTSSIANTTTTTFSTTTSSIATTSSSVPPIPSQGTDTPFGLALAAAVFAANAARRTIIKTVRIDNLHTRLVNTVLAIVGIITVHHNAEALDAADYQRALQLMYSKIRLASNCVDEAEWLRDTAMEIARSAQGVAVRVEEAVGRGDIPAAFREVEEGVRFKTEVEVLEGRIGLIWDTIEEVAMELIPGYWAEEGRSLDGEGGT